MHLLNSLKINELITKECKYFFIEIGSNVPCIRNQSIHVLCFFFNFVLRNFQYWKMLQGTPFWRFWIRYPCIIFEFLCCLRRFTEILPWMIVDILLTSAFVLLSFGDWTTFAFHFSRDKKKARFLRMGIAPAFSITTEQFLPTVRRPVVKRIRWRLVWINVFKIHTDSIKYKWLIVQW